ncbi:MAG: hypothetical protein V7695_08810 [Sulfitobacter sp.]
MEEDLAKQEKTGPKTLRMLVFAQKSLVPFRRAGTLLSSTAFWLAILVIGNILFFVGNLWKPAGDYIDEIVTFGGSSNELIATIRALEESSGVPMEQFIDVAVANVKTLRVDIANAEARTKRIEAALVQPLTHTWRYKIADGDSDCLGGMETIFRKNQATRILSHEGVREANFVDSIGYVHAFSAMCFENDLAIFATGYSQEGTQEIFSDVIKSVSEKWPVVNSKR